MAEMTLEQVRDWHAEEYEIWQAADEYDRAQHSFACMRAIESAIAECQRTLAEPVGWKLVPIEPTGEMVEAWAAATSGYNGFAGMSDDEANRIVATSDWQAMLAAAPNPTHITPEVTP